MSLTPTQEQAITARGNVLVVAGAGTGKTRTLVERCLNCLLEGKPAASLDEILVVTFTEAAAAEMRQRLRARLEQEAKLHPGETRWQEQLALFETAHIGTLHSFCLQLIRQHFYELELDPQLTVLAAEEARLLASDTLETVLDEHYAGEGESAEAVRQLIQTQGRGSDEPIRGLVLRLHHYTQTLPDPAAWFRRQLELFAAPEPAVWQEWLRVALGEWRERWLPTLERSEGNGVAANCAAALNWLLAKPAEAGAVLETIIESGENCERGKKTAWVKPLSEFLGEAKFLMSLMSGAPKVPGQGASTKRQPPGTHALSQDWQWVRGPMSTLLKLAEEFSDAFAEAKRELGVVDFHDLEQHALRLLWDTKTNQPTQVAQQWRTRLRFVFVDEYQDINAAQDKIIEALSRDGARANRFLVGDVKQSIYRFRLANPAIFQGYVRTWGEGAGQVIPLTDNFRSREGILNFVNSVFAVSMRPELGGVAYDDRARLHFGAAEERAALSAKAGTAPSVELHLRVKAGANHNGAEEDANGALAQVSELQEAEKEARQVALRLRELKARQFPVWDEERKQFRPVEWSDMAVLLRSPANKAESYAKEFARMQVPLLVESRGFYESLEVTDLLSLLQMLDNPLQDWPVLAVLHSPLVGLTINELAAIRLAALKAPFWTALVRWAGGSDGRRMTGDGMVGAGEEGVEVSGEAGGTRRKITGFLERFGRWRRLARQVSLSRCLEAVLAETHYADWLLTQARGEQRQANVQRLLGLAQQFDLFQRQGLFRFLKFVEAQQLAETEPEVAAVSEEDSVRLMSIHQSKGLEFPVVVVADLGKAFNVSDLRAEVILDEEYGLCPQIKPPHTGKRYPSLAYWLASRRQVRELLGEELRLLYVAMTRARDLLLLSGAVSGAQLERWSGAAAAGPAALSSARNYAEWLGQWFAQTCQVQLSSPVEGENALVRWVVHEDAELAAPAGEAPSDDAGTTMQAPAKVFEGLQQRLSWEYPYPAATRQPAKTSVSVLRRRASEVEEDGAAAWEVIRQQDESRSQGKPDETRGPRGGTGEGTSRALRHAPPGARQPLPGTGANAADMGIANHLFLQLVSLERTRSAAELRQEAERLERAGALEGGQITLLDFEALAAFWNSELGRKVRGQAQFVQRELAFTARFEAQELAALTGAPAEAGLDGEFVVVQGVADLAVVLPEEIWLVDFKTDRVRPEEVGEKVKEYEPQLRLYAQALSQGYQRPVSGCWLYLLSLQQAVAVGSGSGPTTKFERPV